jgi:archaellum component FlaC
VQLNMAEKGGLECSEHLPGICETQLLELAADSRESFAVNERRNFKKGKLDFGNFERERKRPNCPTRNAVMARMNRLKKKKFLESIESDVARLSDENAKLKQTLEGQSSLVCSLRKEVNYLKGVLANNKEISMLIKSVHNTGLPVTSSLSKHSPINQMHSTADHNYVCTRSDSSIATSLSGLFDKDSATLASDDEKQQVAIIDDVSLSLSMPPDNCLDLPLLSPSERDLFDTEFSGCYSVQPTTFNSPVAGSAADDEPFMDVGICLHVAKRRVSLEFCSTCSNNALSTWEDVDQ